LPCDGGEVSITFCALQMDARASKIAAPHEQSMTRLFMSI